ncbi:MAG: Ig-like domain-containing protein [Pseudomonadota bacterium]
MFTITVNNVNEAPAAGVFTVTGAEDTAVVVDGWNYTDPDGDQAAVVRVTALPQNGTLFLDADGDNVVDPGEEIAAGREIDWADAVGGNVKYLGHENWNGSTSLSYQVSDGAVWSGNVQTGGITVNSVDDAPAVRLAEVPESATPGVGLDLTNMIVSDVDTDRITVTLTLSDPSAGVLSVPVFGGASPTFINGVWTVTGSISDVNTVLTNVGFTPGSTAGGAINVHVAVSDGNGTVFADKPITIIGLPATTDTGDTVGDGNHDRTGSPLSSPGSLGDLGTPSSSGSSSGLGDGLPPDLGNPDFWQPSDEGIEFRPHRPGSVEGNSPFDVSAEFDGSRGHNHEHEFGGQDDSPRGTSQQVTGLYGYQENLTDGLVLVFNMDEIRATDLCTPLNTEGATHPEPLTGLAGFHDAVKKGNKLVFNLDEVTWYDLMTASTRLGNNAGGNV